MWQTRLVGSTCLVLGGFALTAPAAQANLPAPPTKLIVPFESVGGVKLGESYAAARAAWGKAKGGTSNCTPGLGCYYDDGRGGHAQFTCQNNRVTNVYIAAYLGAKVSYSKSLAAWHTSKGVGLGSSFSKLKHAYPAGKENTGGYYALSGPHKTLTFFFIDKGVASIGIQKT